MRISAKMRMQQPQLLLLGKTRPSPKEKPRQPVHLLLSLSAWMSLRLIALSQSSTRSKAILVQVASLVVLPKLQRRARAACTATRTKMMRKQRTNTIRTTTVLKEKSFMTMIACLSLLETMWTKWTAGWITNAVKMVKNVQCACSMPGQTPNSFRLCSRLLHLTGRLISDHRSSTPTTK